MKTDPKFCDQDLTIKMSIKGITMKMVTNVPTSECHVQESWSLVILADPFLFPLEALSVYWGAHFIPEEVGHCMLPYIRDQILEVVNESLLVAVL